MTPIFDGHVHLIGEDADDYLAALLGAMDRNGIGCAVVFGVQDDPECPDSLALSAHSRWPDRFVPFTCEVNPQAPDAAEQLDRRLSSGHWMGVGEIYVATDQATTAHRTREGEEREYQYPVPSGWAEGPILSEVLEVCADHRAPALVHCDDEEVMKEVLSRHPRVTLIWAHADWFTSSARLLLAEHSNLLLEVGAHLHFGALHNPDKPVQHAPHMADWFAGCIPLLEDFAGRITYGSDHFEWRHLEPEGNADCAYSAVRQASRRLSPQAERAWRWDTLSTVVKGH